MYLFFFVICSLERVVGELSEDDRARIMVNPWTLPEDLVERQREVLSTRRREEEERKEREQRLAVRRMFEDERILEREKEMRELQKVFVEGQDPRIDQMAVKYRIEVLQEALKTLHEDSGTLCDFAVKARRLACVKLGLVSPAEARNIQTVYEALPMKDWPAEDANVPASGSNDTNEGATVESTPESCCVRESGREEEDERQIFITQVPSSQRMQDEPEQRPFLVHKGRGKKRKNTLSQQPNRQIKIAKFFSSQL